MWFRDVLAPLVATTPLAPWPATTTTTVLPRHTPRADGYCGCPVCMVLEPRFAWSCGAVWFLAIDANTEFPIGIDAALGARALDCP